MWWMGLALVFVFALGVWVGWDGRPRFLWASRRDGRQTPPLVAGVRLAILYDHYGHTEHSRMSVNGPFPPMITRPQGRSAPRLYQLVRDRNDHGLYREYHG